MTYLIDTNVISELRRKQLAHQNVREWAAAQDQDEFYCSCISILELEIGALRMMRRDEAQGIMLRKWINQSVLRSFETRVLSIETRTALLCASLHVPDKRPERDAWIAATAIIHGLTVVTRNTRDFVGTGVELLDPWIAT